MLTVWSLCWGDKYPDYYVQRLQREVKKYLTLEHRFVCITERNIRGVYCQHPPVVWPGWWGKIGLFKPGFCGDGVNLWLDLDVIITSDLSDMVLQYGDSHLACAKNWAQSGHGGCQSSVMIWKGGKGCQAEWIYRYFDPADAHWPPINQPGKYWWGDQEWITHLRDGGRLAVTHFDPALVQSYKYHCRDGLPPEAKIIVFHGNPKPDECSDGWIKWK
jgi:hypothetical protein